MDSDRVEDNNKSCISWYESHAERLVEQYERLSFEQIHDWLIDRLPTDVETLVLDVGAGSGRDAAWFTKHGYDVVAVEPSGAMRLEARRRHPDPRIRWLDDRLPDLKSVNRLGTAFDVILLSAVWMHLPPSQRARCFRKLITLLKPGGLLAVTLRIGEPEAERGIYSVSAEELHRLAREHGAYVEYSGTSADALGRSNVSWAELAIRLPDDGTGALPLLRHIILNDDKSSTYKLALLRSLCRIADSADGLAYSESDGMVRLPMGLVALIWTRIFLPIIRARLPQRPMHDGSTKGLGFAGKGFQYLLDDEVSTMDLRLGMRFEGDRAKAVAQAVRESAQTITRMPAYYITYPNSGQVFVPHLTGQRWNGSGLVIDASFLWSFGEFKVPESLWRAFQRFAVWVEPALITEWKRLIARYAVNQGRQLDTMGLEPAFEWPEPTRQQSLARRCLSALQEKGLTLYCVWSGRPLSRTNADIDHCFPWSAWPCDDLWNMLPSSSKVNKMKGSRLPDADSLQAAQDSIQVWWNEAYQQNTVLEARFQREATASLPGIANVEQPNLDDIFSAVNFRRIRLKHDQCIPEWKAPRS